MIGNSVMSVMSVGSVGSVVSVVSVVASFFETGLCWLLTVAQRIAIAD